MNPAERQPMRMVVDRRIPSRPSYVLLDNGEQLMNVPDEIRLCTAFVGGSQDGAVRWIGTAFLVCIEQSGLTFPYWVTARHVLSDIAGLERRSDDFTYLRINRRGGGVIHLQVKDGQWVHHPTDQAADVAVVPAVWNGEMQAKAYPITSLVGTREVLAREGLGLGDVVFMPGLFPRHIADERNTPIIRTGTIAAVPEVRIQTKYGDAEGYLIELRSLGGHSGAPVFVHQFPIRVRGFGIETNPHSFYLLGLIHGHWKLPEEQSDQFGSSRKVYSGLGIVTPVEKIVDTINFLEPMRAGIVAQVQSQNQTTTDCEPRA